MRRGADGFGRRDDKNVADRMLVYSANDREMTGRGKYFSDYEDGVIPCSSTSRQTISPGVVCSGIAIIMAGIIIGILSFKRRSSWGFPSGRKF